MYTATLLGDTKNIEKRRRMINVEFTDGVNSVTNEFQFSLDETVPNMKKRVKEYLDDLNYESPDITGDIADYTPEVKEDTAPTAAELAKTAWDADLEKLKQVKELIKLGVLTGDEAPVVALQNKVNTGFKASYIA